MVRIPPDDGVDWPSVPRVIDFRGTKDVYYRRDWKGLVRMVDSHGHFLENEKTFKSNSDGVEEVSLNGQPTTNLSGTSKQSRARARRRLEKGIKLSDRVWAELHKPLDEWDPEELARGRPRGAAGDFRGPAPKYITRELHERAMEKFKVLIRDEMNVHSITALKTVQLVLESEEYDAKGKPIVPASTKLDAAKFLLEHIVGKPTQPTTTDISVKLQGILGAVMVNPSELLPNQYTPAHVGTRGELEGAIDAEVVDEDYFEDELDE